MAATGIVGENESWSMKEPSIRLSSPTIGTPVVPKSLVASTASTATVDTTSIDFPTAVGGALDPTPKEKAEVFILVILVVSRNGDIVLEGEEGSLKLRSWLVCVKEGGRILDGGEEVFIYLCEAASGSQDRTCSMFCWVLVRETEDIRG